MMSGAESMQSLVMMIEARGRPDKFIDVREEESIFEKGAELGVTRQDVESALHRLCRDNGWTRERDIAQDLLDHLLASSAQGNGVGLKDFQHCVNYGVSMNVPRRQALRWCVRHVIENEINTKRRWFGLGRDWFAPLKEQYGQTDGAED